MAKVAIENQTQPPRGSKMKTPLHRAIRNGEIKFLEKLFEYDCAPDIEATDELGLRPLHVAVLCKIEEIVNMLIRNGANLNVESNEMETLPELKNAINESNMASYQKRDNIKICTKLTPLHMASLIGSSKIVSALIENGADVNVENHNGSRPIHCALFCGYDEIISVLFRNNAELGIPKNFKKSDSFFLAEQFVECALETNNLELIKLFIDNCDPIESGRVLNIAVEHISDVPLIDFLCKIGIDVNYDDGVCTPIHWALFLVRDHDQYDVLKCLIKNGANINARVLSEEGCLTPLLRAVIWNKIDLVKLVIEHGADINCPIFWDWPSDSDDPMSHSSTPLQIAISKGRIEIAEFLIQSGADLNIQNDDGMTALHYAIEEKNGDLIQALITNGADTEARSQENTDEFTEEAVERLAPKPLELALKREDIDAMKMFLNVNH